MGKQCSPDYPFIGDVRQKDFVVSVTLTEERACSPKLMREFTAACPTSDSIP